MYDELLATFAHDKTSLSPREIVHLPEGVKRKIEGEDRNGQDVEDHPTDHVPLASEDEHQSLETVYSGKHNNGVRWNRLVLARNQVDEIDNLFEKITLDIGDLETKNTHIANSDRCNDGREQIDEDDKAHGEAAEATKLLQED